MEVIKTDQLIYNIRDENGNIDFYPNYLKHDKD